MKIFSWVNRKFHNKDESSENVKMIKAEHGTGALLEQMALGDVIDDWRQGILAIGTFGYDPSPNSLNQHVQFHLFENEELEILENKGAKEDGVEVENETSDDGGKHSPLVLNASKDLFINKDIVCDHDQNVTKSGITMVAVDDLENLECAKGDFYEKKERITLADLFLADSAEYMQHAKFDDQGEVLNEPKSKNKSGGDVYSKLRLPFTKKFIPLMKKEYSNSSSHSRGNRGIKNIHKRMTKMLKKKIHPELESKKQIKKENHIKYGGNGVIEIASLLQTQDSGVCS